MKQKVTTHDHASATLEAVEKAAIERGAADSVVRDDALECAKYRRAMALEAELDAWKLRYERMKASRDAMSVERDNLEDCIMQREQHLKSCENALIEAQAERDDLKQALQRADSECIMQSERAAHAKAMAWACTVALLLIVAHAVIVTLGGAV